MDFIDKIAFTLFLEGWLYDEEKGIEDISEERLEQYRDKWQKDFVPSLNQEHCGDCTNVCSPCTRCITENYFKQAVRIINVFMK